MYIKTILTAVALTSLITLNEVSGEENNTFTLNNIAWIAGTWEGLGPDDFTGKELSLSVWSTPVDGSMSWTFRYHTPENSHVHYAFTVLEETDAGVFSRGIHFGRDFKNFEKAAWVFQMTAASDTEVTFDCIENCRLKSLTFELTEDGHLLEKYTQFDEAEPSSIFRYKRAPEGN